MRLLPKTVALLVTAAVLALLNLLPTSEAAWQDLPALPGFDPAQVTRIEISNAIEKTRIDRVSTDPSSPDHERWRMTDPAPIEVDPAQVMALLKVFAGGVPMDAEVDDTNYDTYAVDHQDGKLLEVFAGADTPVVSVWVGKNASGSTSFVRPSSGDEVYRAAVGGRGRYDRPPADWRDRVVLDAEPGEIASIVVTRGEEVLRFDRSGERWSLAGAPFPLDPEIAGLLVRSLGKLRALQFQNPSFEAGFDAPAAVAELALDNGATHRVVLGSRVEKGTAFVRVDTAPEVVRVSAQLYQLLTLDLGSFRDRTMLDVPTAEIASITLTDQGLTVTVEPDGDAWKITQPPNMDADQASVARAVTLIAGLQAGKIAADQQFLPSGARLVVRRKDGRAETVELGGREQEGDVKLLRARVVGRPLVYLLPEAAWEELKRAFGRG